MHKFMMLVLAGLISTACVQSNYHVVEGPRARVPWGQAVDVLIFNNCAPTATFIVHGVASDSAVAMLRYSEHATIRLRRPLFSGQQSFRLVGVVQAFAADGRPIGTAARGWVVNYWDGYKQPTWEFDRLDSPRRARCPA